MNGPIHIDTSKSKLPLHSLRYQPTPINDFLNFKNMTSNEILLNLDNNENLQHSELVGGLIELTLRDRKQEHDWNEHPITAKCLEDLKIR